MTNAITNTLSSLSAALLIAAQMSAPVVAGDALQRIPENVLGFAVVHNLAEASTKAEQLLQPLKATFPAPLTLVKLVTGLDEGLDPAGDLVIALLPGGSPQKDLEPLVLLPVTSYAEFAASINADASGEICRVTLLGEDILVAQDGPYAMLMNVEHRQTMEELVGLPAEPIAALAPLAGWLPSQDVAVVLMPAGVLQLSQWKRKPTRRLRTGYEFIGKRSLLADLLADGIGPQTRAWLRSSVELTAVGVAVDEQLNVRLGEQLVLKKNSRLAKLASTALPQPTAKLGLSDQPLVFAAGGPVAPGWGRQLATFLRQSGQQQAAEQGFENFTTEHWDQDEQAYRHLFAEIRSCSVVMLQGEKGEPLVGNFLGVATVVDASKYLESLPKVVKTWNELTQQSTNDEKLEFELLPLTIADKSGYEIVTDIASTFQDPNVPALKWMYESAFGPSGKFRMRFIPVDQTTIIFGLATERQLAQLLTATQQNKTTQPQSAEMQATLQLLQPAAPWKMLVQPQGCLRWASRYSNEFLGVLNNREVTIPEMPSSPPVGLTVNWIDLQLGCEVVCPAETWKTLASYLATHGMENDDPFQLE